MVTKIDIISGFLGAGKTTFIKKLVKDLYIDTNVVILENEFGKVNIDEGTFQRVSIQVKSIYAGCICCSCSLDLARGINEILSEYRPDRIIIEPTGIAKLSDIKKLLLKEAEGQAWELDHIITIVDAKNYHVRALISKDFFEDQIRASELIFLSKTELLDQEGLEQVKDVIQKLQPACHIVDEVWDNISPDRLKEFLEYKPEASNLKHKLSMRVNHVNDFDSYEIIMEKPLGIEQITSFIGEITNGIYGEIHRVKGLCFDAGQGMYTVDYIPQELIIKPIDNGQIISGTSKLCLIGRLLDKNKLDTVFP